MKNVWFLGFIFFIVPVYASMHDMEQQLKQFTAETNQQLDAHKGLIAQGLEQQIQNQKHLTAAQKQQTEQLAAQAYNQDANVHAYITRYFQVLGSGTYKQSQQLFTLLQQRLQVLNDQSFCNLNEIKALLHTSEQGLATLYTAYDSFQLTPHVQIASAFTTAFYDVFALYAYVLQRVSNYIVKQQHNIVELEQTVHDAYAVIAFVLRHMQDQIELYAKKSNFTHIQNAFNLVHGQKVLEHVAQALQTIVGSFSGKSEISEKHANVLVGLFHIVRLLSVAKQEPVLEYNSVEQFQGVMSAKIALLLEHSLQTIEFKLGQDLEQDKKILHDILTYLEEIRIAYTMQKNGAMQAKAMQQKIVLYKQVQKDLSTQQDADNTLQKIFENLQKEQASASLQKEYVSLDNVKKTYAQLERTYQSAQLPTLVNIAQSQYKKAEACQVLLELCLAWRSWISDQKSSNDTVVSADILHDLHKLSLLVGGKNPYAVKTGKNAEQLALYAQQLLHSVHFAFSPDLSNLQQQQEQEIMQGLHAANAHLSDFYTFINDISACVQDVVQTTKKVSYASILQLVQQADLFDQIWNSSSYLQVYCPQPYDSWKVYILHIFLQAFQKQDGTLREEAGILGLYIESFIHPDVKIFQQYVQQQASRFSHQKLLELQSHAQTAKSWKKQGHEAWLAGIAYVLPWYIAAQPISQQEVIQRFEVYARHVAGYVSQYAEQLQNMTDILGCACMAGQVLAQVQVFQNTQQLPQNFAAHSMIKSKYALLACMTNSSGTGLINRITKQERLFIKATKNNDVKKQQAIRKTMQESLHLYQDILHLQGTLGSLAHYFTGQILHPTWFHLQKKENDLVCSCMIDEQHNVSYTLSNYKQYEVVQGILQDMQGADYLTHTGDFRKAAQAYTFVISQLRSLLEQHKISEEQVSNVRKKYYLAQTRLQAAGVASYPCVYGHKKIAGITKPIASDFVVAQTTITIPESYRNSDLDARLKRVKKNKQGWYEPTLSQAQDIVQAVQVYMVYSALEKKGIDPSIIFNVGTLNYVSTISSQQKAEVATFVDQAHDVGKVLLQGLQTGLGEADNFVHTTLQYAFSDNGNLNISAANFPMGLIQPLYEGGPSAGGYYLGAHMLFQPGSQLIHMGSRTFVPGQDKQADEQILHFMTDVYLAASLHYLDQADTLHKKLQDVYTAKGFTKDAQALYEQLKNTYLSMFSILSDPEQSAYAYASFDETFKQEVADYVQTMFQKSIATLKQFLPKDPSSSMYNRILYDINGILLTEAQAFPEKQTHITQDIAQLFDNAAQACRSYNYMDPVNKRITMYHYKAAASYYMAEQAAYKKAGMEQEEKQVARNINQMYILKAFQCSDLYLDCVYHGTQYTSDEEQLVQVSFESLQQAHEQFYKQADTQNVSMPEMQEYSRVKDLLLHGALYAQFASSYFAKTVDMKTKEQSKIQTEFMKKLVKNGILTKQEATLQFTDQNIRRSVLHKAAQIFNAAGDNVKYQSIWAQRLGNAFAYEYMDVYLGAGQKLKKFDKVKLQNLWAQYFSVVKKTGQALQNPPSAYIG